jgi:hypothetical protein
MYFKLRYRLKSLFVFISISCAASAWYTSQLRAQREAIDAIERLGGSIFYSHEYASVLGAGETPCPIKWVQCVLPRVEFVVLGRLTTDSDIGRSPISIATGWRVFLEENLSGSSEAEARTGAVIE